MFFSLSVNTNLVLNLIYWNIRINSHRQCIQTHYEIRSLLLIISPALQTASALASHLFPEDLRVFLPLKRIKVDKSVESYANFTFELQRNTVTCKQHIKIPHKYWRNLMLQEKNEQSNVMPRGDNKQGCGKLKVHFK